MTWDSRKFFYNQQIRINLRNSGNEQDSSSSSTYDVFSSQLPLQSQVSEKATYIDGYCSEEEDEDYSFQKDVAFLATSMFCTRTHRRIGGTGNRNKRNRSVKFASRNKNITYFYESNVSDNAKKWFSKKELWLIKKRNDIMASQIMLGQFTEGQHSCRGLERKVLNKCDGGGSAVSACASASSLSYYKCNKLTKVMSIDAVMDEQHRQFTVGISDPNAIAAVYREMVVQCQEDAYEMGLRDMEDSMICAQ